jgi:hypothetical protein
MARIPHKLGDHPGCLYTVPSVLRQSSMLDMAYSIQLWAAMVHFRNKKFKSTPMTNFRN